MSIKPSNPITNSVSQVTTSQVNSLEGSETESQCADTNQLLVLAKKVFQTEIESMQLAANNIDAQFAQAIANVLACSGRVVVTGMGKSGHIAGKIAATLASTGTPAFFVHPGEASHGDLGMITPDDTVIAISYSGESPEILALLPLLIRHDITLIAMTGNPKSTLARKAATHLTIAVTEEACPLGLAPTSSTTVTLALGDALAVAALKSRGFTKEDFARSHPGGSLGKRLLLTVSDLMHSGEQIPKISSSASILDALVEMTQKKLGMTCILNNQNELLGIFTDGDIRRTFSKTTDFTNTSISTVMTSECKTIYDDELAAKALEILEQYEITSLVVLDRSDQLSGIIHLHDLLKAGIA